VPAFAAANPRNGDGARLFNTPPHNWRLDFSYTRELGAGWEMFSDASAALNGSARVQDNTVDSVSGYTLYNATVGARKGAYELRLYGENLSDERGPTAANGPTLLAGPYPRTVGLGARVRFE